MNFALGVAVTLATYPLWVWLIRHFIDAWDEARHDAATERDFAPWQRLLDQPARYHCTACREPETNHRFAACEGGEWELIK